MRTISGTSFYSGLAAERAAFSPLQHSAYFFETDTNLLYVWDGAWNLVTGGGGGGTPSGTVVTEQTFGQASTAGIATAYSRGDHTHGTMTDPVPAHDGLASAHAAATNLEKTVNKGAVSGYSPLDGAQKVPTANLGGAGASGSNFLRGDQTWAVPAGLSDGNVFFVIDGGGSAITTGSKGYVILPFSGIITSWTILGDVAGSIVIDVKKSTYVAFPSTASIAGTEKPTLAGVQKNQDLSLGSWTTAIAAGDILEFVVDSVATVTRVQLSIKVTKSS